jgi:mRNA interferase RelE/StbE
VRLLIEKAAARALARMPPKVAAAIRASLDAIAADPFAHHANVKLLTGVKDSFRLRHGDWRVLYRVDRASQTVYVEWVKSRGGAYR